jgi:hypothetical protein
VFKSILHYSGRDPDPSVPIDEIRPLSRRAHVLMLRNRTKPLLAEGFLNIAGAIEMLAGLEYHHDRIWDECHVGCWRELGRSTHFS